ncbi:MAG: type II toxin-antitoxin system HicB family antitoxin [Pyrinomonadaceae bacterium]
MKNVMTFGEYHAAIDFDPEIEMFRGEFIDLNGGADFYADSIKNLRKEGEISLRVFLDFAREKDIDPKKPSSGKLILRLKPEIHKKYRLLASSKKVSLNKLLNDTLEKAV